MAEGTGGIAEPDVMRFVICRIVASRQRSSKEEHYGNDTADDVFHDRVRFAKWNLGCLCIDTVCKLRMSYFISNDIL